MSHQQAHDPKFYVWLQPHPQQIVDTPLEVKQLLKSSQVAFTLHSMDQQFRQLYPMIKQIHYYHLHQNDYSRMQDNIWPEIDQRSDKKENYTVYYRVIEAYKPDIVKFRNTVSPPRMSITFHQPPNKRLNICDMMLFFVFDSQKKFQSIGKNIIHSA